MPPKKDLKKKRKPRKKKVTNQNINKQTVIIHNATPQPAKRKYTRRKPKEQKDKFSVPTSSESFVLNLLSRFQPPQQPQDYAQLKNIPEPAPKMPHEKLEYDYRDDVSDISEDGRTFDMDNISRFTGDNTQVPKYGNLQVEAPIKEEEGSGGGAEQPITPVQPKKKRNEPSSASPAKTRNASKRWEKYNDEELMRQYTIYQGWSKSKSRDSNIKMSKAELLKRGVKMD